MIRIICFVVVIGFYVWGNVKLFSDGWRSFGGGFAGRFGRCRFFRAFYGACFWLIFLAFPVSMLCRDVLPLWFLRPAYFLGSSWLFVFLYTIIIFLLSGLFCRRKGGLRVLRVRLLVAYFVALSAAVYGYFRFDSPKVIECRIEVEKPLEREYRVVGVSDLHLGLGVGKSRLRRYVELINAQRPDVVLIAGDLVDNTLRPLEEERMYEEFLLLDAPFGVFASTGNHEYMSYDMQACREFFGRSGIHLLEDSVMLAGDIVIVGRDDISGRPDRRSLRELLLPADVSKPVIVLDHEPNDLSEAVMSGVDVQFSGHTHNGQFFPGNILVKMLYELPFGYLRRGRTHFFVSSGLGIWGPLFRVGTDSDLVVFNIVSK